MKCFSDIFQKNTSFLLGKMPLELQFLVWQKEFKHEI